jgi:hypothetical protein
MCRREFESGWLPTRLIEIDPNGQREPRLIDTKGLDISTPYAALSHMWGDPSKSLSPLETKMDSLKTHMKGIPMGKLSKNFKDAITTTRMLKLRYIWIDSLCIIQDSSGDWVQEALHMKDVYRRAFVTISAYISPFQLFYILSNNLQDECTVFQ